MKASWLTIVTSSVLLLLSSFELCAQVTIHGRVLDGATAVIGAVASESGSSQCVNANTIGYFTIKASRGATVTVSALGYDDVKYTVPKNAATDSEVYFMMNSGKAVLLPQRTSSSVKKTEPTDVKTARSTASAPAQTTTTEPVSTFMRGKALFEKKQYSNAFQLFKQAASEGDSNGYFYMGLCYQRGLGVDIDAYKAFYMCDKAAGMNNPDALFWKAKAFLKSYLFSPKDYSQGIAWLKQAADLGQADACELYGQYLITGWVYYKHIGDGNDIENGMKYFDRAVKAGSVDAYCTLAQYYYIGDNLQNNCLPKDLGKSKYYAEKLKASKTARAYQQLAEMYQDGSIGEKSHEIREALLKKASDMGDGDASATLGNIYFYSKKDKEAAIRFLKLSVEQGSFNGGALLGNIYYESGEHSRRIESMIDCGSIRLAYESLKTVGASDKVRFLKRIVNDPPIRYSFLGEANNWLGNHYYNGDGVAQSYTEALKYYRKGADYGNGWAAYNIAECYQNGHGVEKSSSSVFYWLKKAAEANLPAGQKDLGYCYFKGIGTSVNHSESFRYFKKAADQEEPEAQYMLAYHYGKGWGTSLDKNQCVAMLEKSAANGYEPAKKELPKVRAALQQSQSNNMFSVLGAMGTSSFDLAYQSVMSSIMSSTSAQLNSMQQMAQDVIASTPPEAWAFVGGADNAVSASGNSYDAGGSSAQERLVGSFQAFGLSNAYGSTVTHSQTFQIYQDANGYYTKEAYGVRHYLYRNTHQEFLGYNVSGYNWCLGHDVYYFFRL